MSAASEDTFKILKDYFRNQLVKHFESLPHSKCLVVEKSLLGVVQHLFTQPPETCRVFSYGALFDHKVFLLVIDFIGYAHWSSSVNCLSFATRTWLCLNYDQLDPLTASGNHQLYSVPTSTHNRVWWAPWNKWPLDWRKNSSLCTRLALAWGRSSEFRIADKFCKPLAGRRRHPKNLRAIFAAENWDRLWQD